MTKQRDLSALFDQHVTHEFVEHDIDAAMATMVAEPYVWAVPLMGGGVGQPGVRSGYEAIFGHAGCPPTRMSPRSHGRSATTKWWSRQCSRSPMTGSWWATCRACRRLASGCRSPSSW